MEEFVTRKCSRVRRWRHPGVAALIQRKFRSCYDTYCPTVSTSEICMSIDWDIYFKRRLKIIYICWKKARFAYENCFEEYRCFQRLEIMPRVSGTPQQNAQNTTEHRIRETSQEASNKTPKEGLSREKVGTTLEKIIESSDCVHLFQYPQQFLYAAIEERFCAKVAAYCSQIRDEEGWTVRSWVKINWEGPWM